MIKFGYYRKTGPEGEFPLLTGEKRNINVTPRSPWSTFWSHWRNADVKQVRKKSQVFWFMSFCFWSLPYTMETHT